MKSPRSIISLSLLLLPAVAHAVGILEGWGVPIRRDHDQVFRHEVRDVHSLFTRIQNNQQQDVQFSFHANDSRGKMPKGETDLEKALKRVKGERSSRTTSDKTGKSQKCKTSKKNKGDDDDDCGEDSGTAAAPASSSPVSATAGDLIRFDTVPQAPEAPVASPVWTYAPAWTPSWPFYSPASPVSPVATRFGEDDSTEAPAVAPVEAPISVAPFISTDAPVMADGAMTRLTKAPTTWAPATSAPVTYAPATYAPATYAPVTSAPVQQSSFHFPDSMVHHSEAPVAPSTVAPVTAAPITDVDTLDTHGEELTDAAPQELHAAVVEEVTPEGTSVYKLQVETDTLVINFGGPGLDLTAVEAIMYEKLVTLLTTFFTAEIGTMFQSFDLSLNFSEEIINEATGEVNVTETSEATTVVIGSVEVGTIINLSTHNSISLLGFDETYATNILKKFFDGDLQELLDELDGVNMGLSFMELETSDSYVESIATHNVGDTSTEAASTALIAGALAGLLVFVTGAALATRRWKSNDDDNLSQFFGEEDQLHPLSHQEDGAASTIGFPTAEDIEEEDSMGSDTFLDWAQPDRPRSSRITRNDMDGDLFPVDL